MNETLIPDPVREMPKMGLPKPKPRFTVDEYLEMERKSEERHVYLDGEIFAMAGESIPHGNITVNNAARASMPSCRCRRLPAS